MASSQVLTKQSYRRALWKNGLGHTDEIAIHPAGSSLAKGDFLWRLSSARIERASPFSAFPAHDRTLVVLDGAGLKLTHVFEEGGDAETVDLPPLEPYDFPGDVPSHCELAAGPITDLSVFVRKAEAEATTEVVELQAGEDFEWMPSGRWNFAMAAQGSFEVASMIARTTQRLEQGDTLRLELDEPLPEDEPVRVKSLARGRLVLVSLQG